MLVRTEPKHLYPDLLNLTTTSPPPVLQSESTLSWYVQTTGSFITNNSSVAHCAFKKERKGEKRKRIHDLGF